VIPWRARSPQVRTRPLIDVDEAVAAPADGGKPGARADNRRRAGRGRDRLAPTVEPQRRRAGVQPAFSLAVLPAIPKHINDRVAHCPRGGECPGVIAIPPHGPVPAERTVRRARHADGETPDAAAERPALIGLDEEMEMIVLHAEVEEAEVGAGGSGEGAADGREHPVGAQAADGRPRAERHVHGMRRAVRGARNVRNAGAAARGGLATGACAMSSPGARGGEGQLVQEVRHLESAVMLAVYLPCVKPRHGVLQIDEINLQRPPVRLVASR